MAQHTKRCLFASFQLTVQAKRYLNCGGDFAEMSGLILGLWSEDSDDAKQIFTLTKTAQEFDEKLSGKLSEYIRSSGPVPQKGETRLFYGLSNDFATVAVVGLGNECVGFNEEEEIDEWKESIRIGAGAGARALQDSHIRVIYCDGFGHAESSAEGACLGVWRFQDLRNPSRQRFVPKIELYGDCDFTGWQIGLQKASSQNLARQLTETPANLLTPIVFAQGAVDILCKAGVNVDVKVMNWAKLMDMYAFLAASRGSCEPPIFLEASYFGCEPDVAPVVLVGKGTTFNSGGMVLKDCKDLKHMRGDMAGAACVIGTVRAASALQLPINIRAVMPLSENLPGTCAMKVGDIVRSRNGKTILVEDVDFDGRLGLADALCYTSIFNPKFVVDVGTLTSETNRALGESACAVFSNSDSLYESMRIASIHTGDRIWRMPLWDHFTEKVSTHPNCDVCGRFKTIGATCSCAAFLREFVPNTDWIHMDTYGVNRTDGASFPYIRRGMSGRPTRTLVEFLAQLACSVSESASAAA